VLANFAELTAKGEAEEAVKLATRSQNELSNLIRFVKKAEKIAKEIKPIYESVISKFQRTPSKILNGVQELFATFSKLQTIKKCLKK